MATQERDPIKDLTKAWKAAEAADTKARETRAAYDQALLTAKDAGHTYTELAEASGLSDQRIMQIVRSLRKNSK